VLQGGAVECKASVVSPVVGSPGECTVSSLTHRISLRLLLGALSEMVVSIRHLWHTPDFSVASDLAACMLHGAILELIPT